MFILWVPGIPLLMLILSLNLHIEVTILPRKTTCGTSDPHLPHKSSILKFRIDEDTYANRLEKVRVDSGGFAEVE